MRDAVRDAFIVGRVLGRCLISRLARFNSFVSALAVVVVVLGAGQLRHGYVGHASASTSDLSHPPVHGALLGAVVEQREGVFWSQALVKAFEKRIGRKLDIDHYGYWTTSDDPCAGEFPRKSREGWDIAHGRLPLATWTPDPPHPRAGWLDQFSDGAVDPCLRRMARALKAQRGAILLRPMHEMNGDWYAWSGPQNGGGHVGEAKFRRAWIHMWTVFHDVGATNVKWVWCPDSTDTPADGSHHWTGYYPGDRYVDWVCVDTYNWNVRDWGPWAEFSALLGEQTNGRTVYSDYAKRKPFMIGETGTVEDQGNAGRKGRWFVNALHALKTRFPLVKAFVYFNTIADDKDWRIETSRSSIAGFRRLAQDRWFETRVRGRR